MSVILGSESVTDYPVYYVNFTLTGSSHFAEEVVGFLIASIGGAASEMPGAPTGGLGYGSDADLISVIAVFLTDNGGDGGTVSNLNVTKYMESATNVTP